MNKKLSRNQIRKKQLAKKLQKKIRHQEDIRERSVWMARKLNKSLEMLKDPEPEKSNGQ